MDGATTSPGAKSSLNWREDLNASRNLSRNEVQAFGFVVGWFEDWRVRMYLWLGIRRRVFGRMPNTAGGTPTLP